MREVGWDEGGADDAVRRHDVCHTRRRQRRPSTSLATRLASQSKSRPRRKAAQPFTPISQLVRQLACRLAYALRTRCIHAGLGDVQNQINFLQTLQTFTCLLYATPPHSSRPARDAVHLRQRHHGDGLARLRSASRGLALPRRPCLGPDSPGIARPPPPLGCASPRLRPCQSLRSP